MKRGMLVLIPVLLLTLLFILFASNRVVIPHNPPMPLLSPVGGLHVAATLNGYAKVSVFEGTLQGKDCTVKLTAFPLAWGTVIPATSAQVKASVEDDHKELKRIMGARSDDLTDIRELSFNGKPGCSFVLSRSGTPQAYAKVLEFVHANARYQLSSSVKGGRGGKGGKISAQDKAQADARFEQYLSELQTAMK